MNPKALFRLAPLVLLALTGCATSSHWAAAGGNKDLGLVRLSYEFAGEEPAMSVTQAMSIAENRCNTWGFDRAAPIAGVVRDCADKDGNRCDLWKVTREYQCEKGQALAKNAPPASLIRDRSLDRYFDEASRAPLDSQRNARVVQ
jgi:hypothetical protein